MKHFITRIMATAMALSIAFVSSISAKAGAIEQTAKEPEKVATMLPSKEAYGDPINVISYVDEELDATIIERTYEIKEKGSTRSAGAGWFRNEKQINWSGGGTSTYFVEAYFVWDGSDVSVSNEFGGIDYIPSLQTMSNPSLSTATGNYLGIFNKYASATFSFTMTSAVGMSSNYSVTIRVSQNGNQI